MSQLSTFYRVCVVSSRLKRLTSYAVVVMILANKAVPTTQAAPAAPAAAATAIATGTTATIDCR